MDLAGITIGTTPPADLSLLSILSSVCMRVTYRDARRAPETRSPAFFIVIS